jgi:TetR/AcrR family transcriptional regulator
MKLRTEPVRKQSSAKSRGTTRDLLKSAPKRTTRDSARTKEKILAVAALEFASKGYDGARVDEIVRRGKVSKNLIYYYYGSKEALFIAVLEAAYLKLREQQDALHLHELAPQEAIRKLVVDLFKFWAESKAFIGFLTSENLYKAKHIKKSKFAQNAYGKLIDGISAVLKAGEKEGVFRPAVDPVDLYISISGLSYQYFANQYTLSVVLGRDLTSEQMLDARLKHTVDVILGYLQYDSSKRS